MKIEIGIQWKRNSGVGYTTAGGYVDVNESRYPFTAVLFDGDSEWSIEFGAGGKFEPKADKPEQLDAICEAVDGALFDAPYEFVRVVDIP